MQHRAPEWRETSRAEPKVARLLPRRLIGRSLLKTRFALKLDLSTVAVCGEVGSAEAVVFHDWADIISRLPVI